MNSSVKQDGAFQTAGPVMAKMTVVIDPMKKKNVVVLKKALLILFHNLYHYSNMIIWGLVGS
jgi:hypothetical protein